MSLPSLYRAFLASLLLSVDLTDATPRLNFAVNSQLPPVAYAAQLYDFVFAADTFKSDDTNISYTLDGQPPWLSIDGGNRRIWGTPKVADIGAPSFNLVAVDRSGPISSSVTLVVLRDRSLKTSTTFLSQLEKVGHTSNPNTLLSHPEETFSWAFSRDVFEGLDQKTQFYAVTDGGAPLPSWLQFDSESLHFSGTTPPSRAVPPTGQLYSFDLIASNVVGFSEAKAQFQIAVNSHILISTQGQQTFHATKGEQLDIPSLLSQLSIDGAKVVRSDLVSIVSDSPSWLRLRDTDLSLSGIVPQDAESITFAISLSGHDTNVANISMSIEPTVGQRVEQVTIGTVNAFQDAGFAYTVPIPSEVQHNVTTTADLGDLSHYLRFEASNLTINGFVPSKVMTGRYAVHVTFTGDHAFINGTLMIVVVAANRSLTSGNTDDTMPVATPPVEPTTSAAPPLQKPQNTQGKEQTVKLVLGVTIPIVCVVVVIAILLLCLRRRHRRRASSLHQGKREESRTPTHTQAADDEISIRRALAEGLSESGSRTATPSASQPPQIDLSWAPDSLRAAKKRLSKRPWTPKTASIVWSSWDNLIRPPTRDGSTPANAQHELSVIPTNFTAADSQIQCPKSTSSPPALHERTSKTPKMAAVQMPNVPRRIRGAGHGTNIDSALQLADNRSSWQTTFATMPTTDSRPSTVLLESFPMPPSWSIHANRSGERQFRAIAEAQSTLRFVQDVSTESELSGQRESGHHAPSSSMKRSDLMSLQQAEYGTGIGGTTINSSRPQVRRDISMASSGQFDSAISSDSQWEDEELVADENAAGERYWQTASPPANASTNPRLPFSVHDANPQEEAVGKSSMVGRKQPRLSDQRKRVSVEGTELHKTQRSHQGSFRFI